MVLSRCEANFFIVMGWSMLALTAVPFITGCVGLSKLNVISIAEASVGFTSLYVSINLLSTPPCVLRT